MLIIENLNKSYGNNLILENINLSFGKGVYALVAPNGFGKTTLLSMMSTIMNPSGGDIKYNGKSIYKLGENYRDILGYLPQTIGYYENNTAVQNLLYVAALKGIDKSTAKKRIDYMLEQFGLIESKDKKIRTFSGGMKQRIGIIGALLNDPQIILLDEPTAGLDPKERKNLKTILAHMGQEKLILVSTHIISDIEFLANQIIMLKDKSVFINDTSENICNRIKGSIFENVVKAEDYLKFSTKYMILDEQMQENGIKLRFYSNAKDDAKWQEVFPGLNDVFLVLYGKRK